MVGKSVNIKSLITLLTLYVAQGIPLGFYFQALPVFLREKGTSLEKISLLWILTLPWALKFIWSPLIDKTKFNFFGLGHRLSWIIPIQLIVAVLFFAVSFYNFSNSLHLIFCLFLLINFATATSDVATDGFAVEILRKLEVGWGNGMQIGGFYVGLFLGGGFFLILQNHIGWQSSFALLSLIIALLTIPSIYFVRRKEVISQKFQSSLLAKPSILNFFRQKGAVYSLIIIIVLRLGENLALGMVFPFLVDLKFSSEQIGLLTTTVGISSTILGAFLAGWVINYFGLRKSLLLFATLQTITVAGYIILSYYGERNITLAAFVIGADNIVNGILNVAIYSFITKRSSLNQAGTDYTVMSCTHNFVFTISTTLSGFIATRFGYGGYFIIGVILCIIGRLFFPLLINKVRFE